MKRMDEAKKVMEEALPMGGMQDVHFYGRTLLGQNEPKEAFKVFKMNYDKNPKEYTTNVGMGRAYSALGEYKKAIPFLKAAAQVAPDETNKARVEAMIKTLEEGKNIN